nr:MAG TPA: hypothetical protein [Caudoviricetes sp.]
MQDTKRRIKYVYIYEGVQQATNYCLAPPLLNPLEFKMVNHK